jgi:hypothetical protein
MDEVGQPTLHGPFRPHRAPAVEAAEVRFVRAAAIEIADAFQSLLGIDAAVGVEGGLHTPASTRDHVSFRRHNKRQEMKHFTPDCSSLK